MSAQTQQLCNIELSMMIDSIQIIIFSRILTLKLDCSLHALKS